jgi:hypothetical protein
LLKHCIIRTVKHLISFLHFVLGTGKTTTAVNIIAAALYKGLSCLFTSSNPQALNAYINKIPGRLQKLCIAFPDAKSEDGLRKLHADLEDLISCLRDARQDPRSHERNAEVRKSEKRCFIRKLHSKTLNLFCQLLRPAFEGRSFANEKTSSGD